MIERSGKIKERNKKHLIRLIRFWGIFFILTVGLIIISIDILDAFIGMNRQSVKMRNAYIQNQKKLIKNEVSRVVALINYKRSQSESETRKKIKKGENKPNALATISLKKNG